MLVMGMISTLGPQPVQAEEKIPVSIIAVIDTQSILRESSAAKSVRTQIEAFRKTYRNEIAKAEELLRKEEQELKRQRPIISAEAFAIKRRQFEDNVAKVQRSVQDRTRTLDRIYSQSMNKVGKVMNSIVTKMAKKMEFNFVIDRAQVLFAAKNVEITQDVLKQLNKEIPKVKVTLPAAVKKQ